jgi:hypothetical protein
MQEIEDSRRTVLCSPEWESRLKTMIDAHGAGGVWTVQVSRLIGDDQIVILDPNAIEAGRRQSLQRALRDYRFPVEPLFKVENGDWMRRWMT